MRRTRGFTLIELLVALAIFAVVSLLAYGGLASVLETAARTELRLARLGALQRTVARLVDDFGQLAPRPVRDGFGDARPALDALPERVPAVAFTRGGWPNPAGQARSSLLRVEYGLDARVLVRRAWPTLDRAPQNEPLEQRMLDGVDRFEVRYYDAEGRWQTFWPPAGTPADSSLLPRAIEILVEVEGFGPITRLVVP
jgi:general secretion pathway protein J